MAKQEKKCLVRWICCDFFLYPPIVCAGCVLVCFFASGFASGFFRVLERRGKIGFGAVWLRLVGVGLAGFIEATGVSEPDL